MDKKGTLDKRAGHITENKNRRKYVANLILNSKHLFVETEFSLAVHDIENLEKLSALH